MATAHDFDTDGDLDILGTDGQHSGAALYWAQNDGAGFFTVHDTGTTLLGDQSELFLQGVAVGRFIDGGAKESVVLHMHHSPSGTEMLLVPTDPTS